MGQKEWLPCNGARIDDGLPPTPKGHIGTVVEKGPDGRYGLNGEWITREEAVRRHIPMGNSSRTCEECMRRLSK